MKKFLYESIDKNLPSINSMKSKLPGWYKEKPGLEKDQEPFQNKNFKMCIPFLDAMTSGYCVELMCDIVVEKDKDGHHIYIPDIGHQIIFERDSKNNIEIPVPSGHSKKHYVWHINVAVNLPDGYSAIYTHPMNRHDLPFTTLSGIVDADYTVAIGFLPFFLKEDFEGIIKQGTPIAQIIPFKRDSWKSESKDGLIKQGEKNSIKSRSVYYGWYKKNIWNKKIFD